MLRKTLRDLDQLPNVILKSPRATRPREFLP
jgi:hypothetical protein